VSRVVEMKATSGPLRTLSSVAVILPRYHHQMINAAGRRRSRRESPTWPRRGPADQVSDQGERRVRRQAREATAGGADAPARASKSEGATSRARWITGNRNHSQEAEVAARRVDELLAAGATWTDRHDDTHPLAPRDIQVVAPYNAHVGALRQELGEAWRNRVGTVDKLQGQEAPIVIYSVAMSRPEDAPRGWSFCMRRIG